MSNGFCFWVMAAICLFILMLAFGAGDSTACDVAAGYPVGP
jgi:hypothetical protein